MALYKEGASKGATVAFLIATPQTGVDSIIATYSLMGFPFALIRPVVALCTALFAGITTNVFTLNEKSPVSLTQTSSQPTEKLSFAQQLKSAFHYGYVEMMEDIGKMLLFGLLLAGLITYFVPPFSKVIK